MNTFDVKKKESIMIPRSHKIFSVVIHSGVKRLLEDVSKKVGCSVGELIRQSLMDYLLKIGYAIKDMKDGEK